MVFEVLQDICAGVGGLIRTLVLVSVLYGITVNERNLVESGGRDYVTVGGAAGNNCTVELVGRQVVIIT